MARAPLRQWKGVPPVCVEGWTDAFARPSSGYFLENPCPVCGALALCRYYHASLVSPVLSRGTVYQGKGALWEWCSLCWSFEHSEALVPVWWQGKVLDLDHSILEPFPARLEEHLDPMKEFDFSYRDMAAGILTNHGGLPLAPGVIRYEAYRGPGHFELVSALKQGSPQVCTLSKDGQRIEFSVETIAADGTLVVGEV